MSKESFTFKITPEIILGRGAVEKVGQESRKRGGTRILLVSDEGVAKAGLVEKVRQPLLKEKVEVVIFDKVEPEPWVETADEAGEMARRENCNLVVGMGGGSAMDVAKAGSVLATNEGKASDYQGLDKVPEPGLPKIMIPTTLSMRTIFSVHLYYSIHL